jgi:hypothetical protein
MTTAGNLLFADSRQQVNIFSGIQTAEGTQAACSRPFDARTGKAALVRQAPDDINGGPMTYQVNGKQYVALYTSSTRPTRPRTATATC